MVSANAVSIYLGSSFTAAIKADIRQQSEAEVSQLYCFSHHCKAGELHPGNQSAGEHHCYGFLFRNHSVICVKRRRNGVCDMCVNIRNA